jgi:5-methyltetrahydrofolate corrinoid/iron sulfur protein methyltransferase
MLVIGEKVNVINTKIGQAMKDRDAGPILEMAKKQVDAGANLLDLNIGSAKDGPERMEWLVQIIQDAMDVRCCLDSMNPAAIEAGLKVHKGRALINSTNGLQEKMDAYLPLAAQYDADIIGLTMMNGIPRDANERAAIAVDIMMNAAAQGVPIENIYFDPLILPVKVAQEQALQVFEAIKLFKQLNDPPLKTVVGLSNTSNGLFGEIKSLMDSTMLATLLALGLDAAIMDPNDEALMNTLKTVEVFNGNILYAESYLH